MSYLLFVAAFLIYFASQAFCFISFESRHHPARHFVFFSLPVAILVFIVAAIYLKPLASATAANQSGRWLWLHLGLVLGGLAGLLTAVSSAMMYLLQTLQLKSRHPGRVIFKLPSLETLDRVHFTSLLWGSVFLSLGMLTGILWAQNLRELKEVFYDQKVILSLITCLVYWGILLLRFSSLRRGQKIAIGTVHTFILLFFTVVCSHGFSRFSGGR